MSIFRKVPYIEAKLGALNSTQLTAFKNAINSTNNGDEYYSLVDQAHLLRTAIGTETSYIKAISLQLEKGKEAKSGFVVYAGSPAWCMFLTYNQYGNVHIYEIDIVNNTFKRIEEECSIEEVRRVLIDKQSEGSESAWELAIKEYVVQNGSTTEVGGDIEIDGMIKNDEFYSKTLVGEDNVALAEFDPSDNHWHLQNTKVDDTLTIDGELELGDGDLGADLQAKIKEIAGYTAGDGISIDANGVIKAEVSTGLFLDDTGIHLNNASQNAINAVAGKVNTSDIVDNVVSTDTNKPLSANQGKMLNERINNVEARGRFLSTWNASTGQPATLPSDIATTAYTYRTGDYFIVGTAGSKVPSGTSVPAGTTIPTFPSVSGASSAVNDTILFDGTNWNVIHTDVPTVTFGSITGNVSDNSALVSAFGGKQDVISDLDTIRSGAALGATAVQPSALSNYATQTDLQQGLATKETVGVAYTKAESNALLNAKQGTLTAGDNITIDANNVISASGGGGGGSYQGYTLTITALGGTLDILYYDGTIESVEAGTYNNVVGFVTSDTRVSIQTLNGLVVGSLSIGNCVTPDETLFGAYLMLKDCTVHITTR